MRLTTTINGLLSRIDRTLQARLLIKHNFFSIRFRVVQLLATSIFLASVSVSADAFEIREINLATSDLVYDPVSDKIFASVPGSAGANGNSITSIDPVTGAVGAFTFVGSEPGKLARSDDGQYLYVSLDGAAAVRRFHIPTNSSEIQINLGSDSFFGPNYAEDLAVQPGNPNVVAVSRKNLGISPRHAGVAIFDDGIQRPDTTARHTGSNVIEFGFDPTVLYGYNNETTDFKVRTMAVTASGLTTVNAQSTAISGFGVDFTTHQNIAYSTTGVAIDPSTGITLGTYLGVSFANAVVADASLDKIYFLDGNMVQIFNLSTFTFIESVTIPTASGNPSSLVRWGANGLAFRTSNNQVFLLSEALPKRLEISPPSGRYVWTQNFDLVFILDVGGVSVQGASILLDGIDVTASVSACAIVGITETINFTLRCPGLQGGLFTQGLHTINATFEFNDGSSISDTVTWEIIPNSEF